MADRTFSASVWIAREPEAVFDWVADYRHVAQVLEGVERWDPLPREARGRGARFSVSMSALGFPLENVLVLDVWDEPRAIGWRSESGLLQQNGRWEFRPRQEGTDGPPTTRHHPPLG